MSQVKAHFRRLSSGKRIIVKEHNKIINYEGGTYYIEPDSEFNIKVVSFRGFTIKIKQFKKNKKRYRIELWDFSLLLSTLTISKTKNTTFKFFEKDFWYITGLRSFEKGKNFGKILMNFTINKFTKEKPNTIRLTTQNKRLFPYYRSMGFKTINESSNYLLMEHKR